jgi:hypothetical protein
MNRMVTLRFDFGVAGRLRTSARQQDEQGFAAPTGLAELFQGNCRPDRSYLGNMAK